MSDTAEQLARLDEKISIFMTSQSEFNKNINDNLKELSQTQSQIQVQQSEINNVIVNSNRMSGKIDKLNDEMSAVKTNQALTSDFKSQVRQLKWVSVGLFGTILISQFLGDANDNSKIEVAPRQNERNINTPG
tara:strand:- start:267 stop:665 length:399 start_codon:yes stop_codon:yes gene_type:complete